MTPNGTLFAYALALEASIIHIIDLQNWTLKKLITLPSGHPPTSFSCLAFSTNGKYLIAQSNSYESLLYYFDVHSGNLLGTHKSAYNPNSANPSNSQVTHISFNPNDFNTICCTGTGVFRQLMRSDRGFTVKQGSLTNKDTIDFEGHIWTSDGRLVIATTSDGRVVSIDNSSLLINININNPTGKVITHLTTTPKGFVCVTNGNFLHFFERSGEKSFVEINSIQVDEKETIISISIAQTDDHIICLLSDSRLLSIPLTSSESSSQDIQTIKTLLPSLHNGPITCLDVAYRKQLIVSCGEDNSIRVWNYEKMQCIINKTFSDQPLSVSFHPDGRTLISGFTEKLKYMTITIDDIVTHREFPIRGCRECKFSHGGQYFAAVHANNIQIYSSYTFKSIANLRSSGQRIKTIVFSTDDNSLIACDTNGTISVYIIRTGKQRITSNLQNYYVNSIVCIDSMGSKCYGITLPDNTLCELEDVVTTKNKIDLIVTPCQLVLGPNNKCFFVSTNNGTIRIYNFLNSSNNNGNNFPTSDGMIELILHHSTITSLAISPDNNYLFSSGEDGCIYILKIINNEQQTSKVDPKIQFNEDILISKNEFIEQIRNLRKAQQDVIDLENQQKFQLLSLQQGLKQKRKENKQKYLEDEQSDLANINELNKQIITMNEDAENQRISIETQFKQDIQNRQNRFEMNMANEEEQQKQLKEEIIQAEINGKNEYEKILKQNELEINQNKEEFEKEFQKLEQAKNDIIQEKKNLKEEFNQWEIKVGNELAFEIGKRKFEAEQKSYVDKEQTKGLIEKCKKIETELEQARKNVETGKAGLNKQAQVVTELKDQIIKAQSEKEHLQRELEERKNSINEKDIQIEDLTNQNVNLEKHRQLIKDRISNWKSKLEPLQVQQQDISITYQKMKQEQQRYQKNEEQLKFEINELRLKINAKRAEIETRNKQLEEIRQITRQFKIEVHNVHQILLQDEANKNDQMKRKEFPHALAALYRKYVGGESSKTHSLGQQVNDKQIERNRERDALERNITAIAKNMFTRIKEQTNYIPVLDKLYNSFSKINQNFEEIKKEFEVVHTVATESNFASGFEGLLASLETLLDAFNNGLDQCNMNLNIFKSVLLPSLVKLKTDFNKSNNEFQKVIEEYGALGKAKPEVISQTEANLKNVMCQRSSLLYDTISALEHSEKSAIPTINSAILKLLYTFSKASREFLSKNSELIEKAQEYIEEQEPIVSNALKNMGVPTDKNEAYRNTIDCWEIREEKAPNNSKEVNVSHILWYRKNKRVGGGWSRRYVTFEDGILNLYDPVNGRKDASVPLQLVTATQIEKKKRRFCFKVQSPETTILLQAFSAFDLDEWLSIFGNHNTKMIRGDEPVYDTSGNVCADCGASDASWCALNWGTHLCLKCCSTHRQMSTKISKIRSIVLDDLHPFYHDLLKILTNECSNSLLMSKTCDIDVGARMDEDIRTMFVTLKYQKKQWATAKLPPDPFESIERLDFRALVHSMNFGRATDVFEGIKPIHAAAAIGNPIIVAIAVSCTVEVDEPDTNKWTALCYSIFYQNIETVKFLLDCGAKTKETEVDLLLMAVATGNQQLVELFLENTTKSDSEKVQKFVPASTRFAPYGLKEQKELIVTNETRTITRLLRASN
ncbi:cilia- and flagella-associated protein [Histomonas meleagridis]|nr:cilia- and flagella-associated protein [Histomonas meleagridis]